MSIADYGLPDHNSQLGNSYKEPIDGTAALHDRIAGMFVVQEAAVPDLTLRVLPGRQLIGGAVLEKGEQTVDLAPAPVGNPRKDRIVLDAATLVPSVVKGTPDPAPVAPALPAGKLPLAVVAVADGATTLTNGVITDDRVLGTGSGAGWTEIAGSPFVFTGTGAIEFDVFAGAGNQTVMAAWHDARANIPQTMALRAKTTSGVLTGTVYRTSRADDTAGGSDHFHSTEAFQVSNGVDQGWDGFVAVRNPGQTVVGGHFFEAFSSFRIGSTGNFRSWNWSGFLRTDEALVGLEFDCNGGIWANGEVRVFAR